MGKRKIPIEAFALHEERSRKIRKVMVDLLKEVPGDEVAILLSSGVDSHGVLFAALEAGKTPVCYSATLDDRESQDFKGARNTAKTLGLKFVPVYLSTDVSEIYNFVSKTIYNPKVNPGITVGKALVECLWPVARIFDKIKEKHIVTGFNGDTWYCTLRSQKKEYLKGNYANVVKQYYTIYNSPDGIKEPQRIMQLGYLNQKKPGTNLYVPYNSPRMFKVMEGMDPIKEGWKPIQKAPMRLAFWDYFELCRDSVYIHVPLQKGDSGIEEHFRKLLDTDLNTKGYKSTIGIYNDFLRKWRDLYDKD